MTLRSLFISCIYLLLHIPTYGQQRPIVIRFDPANVFGTTASSVFDSIRFIPLETNKISIFGKISKLELTNHHFVILDWDTDAILIFTKDGKFSCKIDKVPGLVREIFPGRNTPPLMGDFSVNNISNQIIISTSYDRNHLYHFNIDGKFVRKQKIPVLLRNAAYLTNESIVIQNIHPTVRSGYTKKDVFPFELLFVNGSSEIYKKELPFNLDIFPDNSESISSYQGFFRQDVQRKLFYTKTYDYTIYRLDSSEVREEYKFVFPLKHSLPKNFEQDTALTNQRIAYVLSHKDAYLGIKSAYKNKKYLSVKFEALGAIPKNILFNLNSFQAFALAKISPDSLTFNLPIFNDREGIIATDQSSVYSTISSLELFSNYKTDQKYSPVLKNYFLKENKRSNPAILQLKLKND